MKRYHLVACSLLAAALSSCSVRPPDVNLLRPAGEYERQKAEMIALPRLGQREIRELGDWIRVSSDRRAVYLNLAYVGSGAIRADENACRDHSPIRMKGNFRPTFGSGTEVYCNPENNWALLDIGWMLSDGDIRQVRCVNVQDARDHWSQHGGETFAPGLSSIGGPTTDAFNIQFTTSGDGTLELINDHEASRRELNKQAC